MFILLGILGVVWLILIALAIRAAIIFKRAKKSRDFFQNSSPSYQIFPNLNRKSAEELATEECQPGLNKEIDGKFKELNEKLENQQKDFQKSMSEISRKINSQN